MYYARKIHRRFNEMTNFEVKNWCITDRPDQIKDLAEPIEPPFKGRGWWNKMKVYDSFYEGNALYLDIDNVLIRNFDDEINVALSALDNEKCKIACVSDAIGFHHNHFSSSMMVLKSGNMQKIWDDFELEVQVSYENFEYEGKGRAIETHLANYGRFQLGTAITASVYYPLIDTKACGNMQEEAALANDNNLRYTGIVIVDAGGCSYETKSRNIEQMGAQAAIIMETNL